MTHIQTDHVSRGKRYLKKGLDMLRNRNIDDAIEAFVRAAIAFERSQDFRQIPALWEAVGSLLEPKFKEKETEWFDQLKNGNIQSIYDKSYQWPLHYRTVSWDTWSSRKDPEYKQAWVYQWAAEHRERANDTITAYKLFLKAAAKAEISADIKKEKKFNKPAKYYFRATLNYIRANGTVDNNEIRGAIERMKLYHMMMKKLEPAKTYRSLAIAYRSLKSHLVEAGNLAEAEQFKKRERFALMHYYFHSRNYFRAITEWLSGKGFVYFIFGFFLMIFFIFPFIYYQMDLITSLSGKITFQDTVIFSIESALGLGDNEFYCIGSCKLIKIIEASLSWLGLGMFIWWLTRRLE